MKKTAVPCISVIIPAHNEEDYISRCIRSVRRSSQISKIPVEILVVCNRCTDSTADAAASLGAMILTNDIRSIAAVRNTGIKAARGSIIVTIDADSIMPPSALGEIREKLESGKYIGGGAIPVFDRASPGIFFSTLYVAWKLIPTMIKNKAALSGALFWFHKADFDVIGGFDESLVSLEDMDFAVRLNRLGKSRGQKWGTLKGRLVTSSRKFDEFGDWYLIRERKMVKRIFAGNDREAADKFYYDARSVNPKRSQGICPRDSQQRREEKDVT